MHGQVAQIILLPAIRPDDNPFRLRAITNHHTVTLTEKVSGTEILVHLERLIRHADVLHSVKREDGKTSIIKLSQQVPALAEQLDAVRRQGERFRLCSLIASVADSHPLALFHRLHHHLQIIPIRGDILQQDAVLQAHALPHQIVDRQCREHPVLHRILPQHLLIADVITIAILPVTINIDAKDILYRILMAVKRRARQRHTPTHIRPHPSLVDVHQRNPSRMVNRIHQPDIFLK